MTLLDEMAGYKVSVRRIAILGGALLALWAGFVVLLFLWTDHPRWVEWALLAGFFFSGLGVFEVVRNQFFIKDFEDSLGRRKATSREIDR